MRRSILLVEDDFDLGTMIKVMLGHANYEVHLCHDPSKALDQAKLLKPGLILMDIMMPNQSGADTVKVLQAQEETKNTPIIFLTALLSPGDEMDKQGVKVGTITYKVIAKPIDFKNLLNEIKNHLG